MKTDFASNTPIECIRVALAIETLAYYDKNYLSNNLHDNKKISQEVQALLIQALKGMND